MTDSLGLSVGMTNLVAVRDGRPPVTRRSVLTLFNDRAPEVGVPSENPNLSQPGLVLGGFVDRVGDPVPLVASDGSSHRGDQVLAEALDAMTHTVGGGNPITVAVPAHWAPSVVAALQTALRNKPGLASAAVVPDSVAALAGLRAAGSLPPEGVVALCDFGGSGTSVTLADAGAQFAPIGATVRYPDFSGEQIDQALLNHVIAGIADAGDADPAGTAAVGSLGRLRDECRRAKERLSAETVTVVPAELPGFSSDVRVTRAELDQLIDQPLGGLLGAIEELLQRNGIAPGRLSAVATVGGGAAIPLVTQRLSERLQVPVITAPQATTSVAAGAALVADAAFEAGAPTGLAPAVTPDPEATGMAPTMGWAGGAAAAEAGAPGGLAWSQDDDAPTGEPVPYQGPDYETGYAATPTDARPPIAFTPGEDDYPAESEPLAWYKRPPLLFGAAAAAALLAVGGLAVTLTGTSSPTGPVTETATSFSTEPGQPGEPVVTEPQTVTVTGDDGIVTTSEIPPPPPPSTTTTTTTTPSTTSSTTTTTTTTTTSTTTTTTTTTPPTTTTTRPVTTTTQPPVITTTTVPIPQPEPEPEPIPVPDPVEPEAG
jgi:Hsp70 protein